MSHTQVTELHAQFRASWASNEDDNHTGGPISSTKPNTVAKFQQLLREDRRQTVQDLADEIKIDANRF
jgi:hypothetical protein